MADQNLVWAQPSDRAAKITEALDSVHQFDNTVAEETTVTYQFTVTPVPIDISAWVITAYLAVRPGTSPPVQTQTLDTGIVITDGPNGVLEVTLSIHAVDGVTPGYYILSLYRTDIAWELAEVYMRVNSTGI